MKNLVVLLAVTTVASALHVGVPTMSAPRRVARSYRAPTIRAALDADDNEASKNEDAAADDGGLMAEFNARLDQEGGATMFKIKSEAKQVGDAAKNTAQKVQWAGEDAADAVGGFFGRLNPQQQNILKIVAGLIAFQILIGTVSSAFR